MYTKTKVVHVMVDAIVLMRWVDNTKNPHAVHSLYTELTLMGSDETVSVTETVEQIHDIICAQ
jgi:hypothetical protein